MAAAAVAFAYNPPTDTAGPVTVSMQAPASGLYGAGGFVDLSGPDVPLTIPVTLQNSSDQPIEGTLRMAVIDHWTVSPASMPFRLGPRGARYEVTVRFGPGMHSAHYPVHAYADFEYRGQKLTAYPVLIVQTRIPDSARPKLPA